MESRNTGSIYLPGMLSSFNSAMNTSFEICGSWTPILTSFAKFGGFVSVFPILWVSMGSSFYVPCQHHSIYLLRA